MCACGHAVKVFYWMDCRDRFVPSVHHLWHVECSLSFGERARSMSRVASSFFDETPVCARVGSRWKQPLRRWIMGFSP